MKAMKKSYRQVILASLLLCLPTIVMAEELTVAVISVFSETFLQIKPLFEQETGHTVRVISDSSGVLYSKIRYSCESVDVFLSADEDRPKKLIEAGLAVPESFTVYALGKLVLWTKSNDDLQLAPESLSKFKYIAFPTPKNSPYGSATQEALTRLKLWEVVKPNLVIFNTIVAAYEATLQHQTQAGFIGLAQYLSEIENLGTNYLIIPSSLYPPLSQAAVMMWATKHPTGAQALLDFLHHPLAIKVIHDFGFGTVDQRSDD